MNACCRRCEQLRLSGLAQTLDVRLQEAAGHQLNHAEFLELILQDELLVRQERQIDRRVKAALFREVKPLGPVRLVVQPVDPEEADLRPGHLPLHPRSAATCCSWGRRAWASRFWSRPSAIRRSSRGFVVLYRSIFDVVRDFLHDEALGDEDKVLAKYLKPDLLDRGRHGHEATAQAQRRVSVRDHHAALRDPQHDDDQQPARWRIGAS